MSAIGAWARTGAAVARRPRLWRPAVVQVRRLAPPRWWARRPYLPVPDRAWMRFRLETQYGDPAHPPVPADVVTWLEWTRANDERAPTSVHRPPVSGARCTIVRIAMPARRRPTPGNVPRP